jgi:hypothetical protein
MKQPPTPAVLEKIVAKSQRRHRARPLPRWLKAQAESPESIGQRRALLLLSVLSGEKPVTDALEGTGLSRQLYYQLEEKALNAMVRALSPGTQDASAEAEAEALKRELQELRARVRQLESEKRRAERLLFLTRKVMPTGPMTSGRGRPRGRASASAGPKPSKSSTASTMASPSSVASSPTLAGATTP